MGFRILFTLGGGRQGDGMEKTMWLEADYISRLFLSVVAQLCQTLCSLFATPWTAARQVSLSFTVSWSLLNSGLLS